jgi:SAM-dependent methyltransferase
MLRFHGSSDIKNFVREHLESRQDLAGKKIADIPAGKGVTSKILLKKGAEVHSYDLFPEVFENEEQECKYADLQDKLPIADESFDMLICQEGIEHLPDQLATLKEFNRVMVKNGTLIITTPNISHLRAKLSNLLTESELYKRMPPNELDAIWQAADNRQYFGHIFLLGIQKLRVLAVAAGFKLKKVHKVKASTSAVILGVLYPVIVLVNLLSYFYNIRKDDKIDKAEKKRVYWEIVKLNMHPTILFGRHLFVEFEKENNLDNIQLFENKRR